MSFADILDIIIEFYFPIDEWLNLTYPWDYIVTIIAILFAMLLTCILIVFAIGLWNVIKNGDEINFLIFRKKRKNPPRRRDRRSG